MDIIQSLILGVIQGITEFFPISSTAHLTLVPWLLSWQDPGLVYSVALHFGSLFAIILYFKNRWTRIIKEFIQALFTKSFTEMDDGKLGLYILIATIPGMLSGYFFEKYASGILREPIIIASSLSIFGLLLLISDHISKKNKPITSMNLKDCLVIGLAQSLAIIPGASRSGVSITGALLRNFNRTESAEFSFMLAAPLILGATIYEFQKVDLYMIMQIPFLLGVCTSCVFSFITIKYLLKIVSSGSYRIFAYYRFLLALVIIIIQYSK